MVRIGLLVALLYVHANATPSCGDRMKDYAAWEAPIHADIEKGAFISDKVDELVALPLRGGTHPRHPAMTLVVDAAGLHDGKGPAVAVGDAKSLVAKNRSIEYARKNKNALPHGIVIHATPDAPAAYVKAAVDAGLATKERVWLTYKPSDSKGAAPPTSSVTDALAGTDDKDFEKLVEIVRREFDPCAGLRAMMQTLSGQTEESRMKTLVDAPAPALEKCACKTDPAVAAAILVEALLQKSRGLRRGQNDSVATLGRAERDVARSRRRDRQRDSLGHTASTSFRSLRAAKARRVVLLDPIDQALDLGARAKSTLIGTSSSSAGERNIAVEPTKEQLSAEAWTAGKPIAGRRP